MLSMLTARVDLSVDMMAMAPPAPTPIRAADEVVEETLLRTDRSSGDSWVVDEDVSDSRDPPLCGVDGVKGRNRCREQGAPDADPGPASELGG